MLSDKHKAEGFTLMEILISIFIFMIVVSISIPITTDLYRSYTIITEVNSFTNILRRAQNFSMSQVHNENHGVHVDADNIILFRGNSFSERDQAFDENYNTSQQSAIMGPSEVVFESLSGAPSATSTWTITIGPNSRDISINKHGSIDW